jgi:cytochrome c biogenesis protein CcmG, thiol:disulfide interchange protein DsbE
MYDKYKAKGLVVLGINAHWDKEQLVRPFMDVYKVTYPVGRDATGSVGKLYGIEATPTSLFIDKAGRLVEQHVGGLEEADFRQRIEALLK